MQRSVGVSFTGATYSAFGTPPPTHPDNLWALRGLLTCLERRGETAEATLIRQRADFASARADLPVSVSCFCAGSQAA